MMNRHAEIEARLARLERQNRFLVLGCIGLAVIPILIGAGQVRLNVDNPIVGQLGKVELPKGATGVLNKDLRDTLQLSNAVSPVVKTKLLCLVDNAGKARATLSTDENSNPALALYDSSGNLRSEWRIGAEGVFFQTFNRAEQPEVRLGMVRSNLRGPGTETIHPELHLGGTSGRVLLGDPAGSFLSLARGGGRSDITVDDNGGVGLELRGQRDQRVSLGCNRDSDTGAFLRMESSPSSPRLLLFGAADYSGLQLLQPDSKFRAELRLSRETGGSIYSRHKQSESTHQIFEGHANQGFSPTRSAHLTEIRPDAP